MVRAQGPIGEAELGEGPIALLAFLIKYRVAGKACMQELHDKILFTRVTAQDEYDSSRVSQELCLVCFVLLELSYSVIDARWKHALFTALTDSHDESLKAVILRDQQRECSFTFNSRS